MVSMRASSHWHQCNSTEPELLCMHKQICLAAPHSQQSTTSFLTATVIVYTSEAGITADAGTRLDLRLILIGLLESRPLQMTTNNGMAIIAIARRCFPPELGLSNLRACCPPWWWWPYLRPPLRNRTMVPRHPSVPLWSTTHTVKLIGQKLLHLCSG